MITCQSFLNLGTLNKGSVEKQYLTVILFLGAIIFLPTYLMTQCLMASVLHTPSLIGHSAIRKALENGLNGCTLNKLIGHGYEAEAVLLDNLLDFLKAGYADFALRYPHISPSFRTLFFNDIQAVKRCYETHQHVVDWGIDLKKEQEAILSLTPDWIFGDYSGRLYIAYGSNMNEEQMASRCPGSELVGIGVLSKAQLDFYRYATVTPTQDISDTVPVAVWRISKSHEQCLDHCEGVKGHFYRKDTVTVRLNNGIEITGLIYLMEKYRTTPVLPDYYARIANAYDRLGLHNRIRNVLEPAKRRSKGRPSGSGHLVP